MIGNFSVADVNCDNCSLNSNAQIYSRKKSEALFTCMDNLNLSQFNYCIVTHGISILDLNLTNVELEVKRKLSALFFLILFMTPLFYGSLWVQ